MKEKKRNEANQKFIDKFLNEDKRLVEDKMVTRRNHFSGQAVQVSELFAAAYDFIQRIEPILYSEIRLKQVHSELKPSNSVKHFDRARSVARELDSRAYMELLD